MPIEKKAIVTLSNMLEENISVEWILKASTPVKGLYVKTPGLHIS